ncbi:MAG: type II toxin-antitoxin system MqsR family toxin [Fusobacteriaceae bacterium]
MQNDVLKELLEKNIQEFLDRCSHKVLNGKLKLIPRQKNMDSIYSMGLSILNIEEIIAELTIENYYKGPTPDHKDKEEEVWEFLVDFEEYPIYIKLRLDEKDDLVVCISFHEAEYKRKSLLV